MSKNYSNEPMLDMYIFETTQLLEQLEKLILSCEKGNSYKIEAINEIFRIMHTIKGSSAMMLFNNIATLAHSIEDLFYFIRQQNDIRLDCTSLSDLVLDGIDFFKVELEKIKVKNEPDGDPQRLLESIKEHLDLLKNNNPKVIPEVDKDRLEMSTSPKQQYYIPNTQTAQLIQEKYYKATIYYQEGCEMENIRAYTVVHNLKEIVKEFLFWPEDIIENDHSAEKIKENGFQIVVKTEKSYDELFKFFNQTIFLKELEFTEINDEEYRNICQTRQINLDVDSVKSPKLKKVKDIQEEKETSLVSSQQSIISVNVAKLDSLMDLVGEMVVAEAMVTQNPDLRGLQLDNFRKAARQLRKINSEIQDIVMSIRMVPLATTFHKMHRIVRDMSKKLRREVQLELIGEQTEVDKNIIEHISDPLMHLIRNAIDHGIESAEERRISGKPTTGTITLEARNIGSDVLVMIRDDGKGLNKDKILAKAHENGLLIKHQDEMSDKEIFNIIFLPGFSTKEAITEFSGRGVGMDVVTKNLQTVGGTVSVDSKEGCGTTITLKIPLTLAIIDGMNIRVGESRYTIPTISIKESFRPQEKDIIEDPDGNEIIMVRGNCYPILRLHDYFKVQTKITSFTDGIFIMVEHEEEIICLFADALLGEQQVVVKPLPNYFRRIKQISGLTGCTLLGDGNISLILDISGLIHK